MKKVTRIIHIGLYKPQQEIADKIEADGLSLAEVVRASLTEYGKEHYPPDPGYVEVEKRKLSLKERTLEEQEAFDKMDPKEYTIKELHGLVDEKNQLALFCYNGGTDTIPLSKIKELRPDSPRLEDHFAIMNGTFVHQYGPSGPIPWTKEQCEKRWNDWHEEVERKLKLINED